MDQWNNVPMANIPRRWLTLEEQKMWRAYLESHFRLFKYLNDDVEKHSHFDSLTYEILVRLSESPERSMRMKDLAASVSAAKSRLTYRIGQLEKEGWVQRSGVEEDRRGQQCVLTDKGFSILEQAAPHHVEAVLTQFIEKIPSDKIAELTEIWNAIAEDVHVPACDGK